MNEKEESSARWKRLWPSSDYSLKYSLSDGQRVDRRVRDRWADVALFLGFVLLPPARPGKQRPVQWSWRYGATGCRPQSESVQRTVSSSN